MFPDRYPADMVCGDDDDGTAASGADDVPLRRAAATSTGNSYKTGDKAFERSEKKTNTSPSSVNFGEDFLVRRATEIKKKKKRARVVHGRNNRRGKFARIVEEEIDTGTNRKFRGEKSRLSR